MDESRTRHVLRLEQQDVLFGSALRQVPAEEEGSVARATKVHQQNVGLEELGECVVLACMCVQISTSSQFSVLQIPDSKISNTKFQIPIPHSHFYNFSNFSKFQISKVHFQHPKIPKSPPSDSAKK